MQYLLLIYSDEKASADMPKEAMDSWMGEYYAYRSLWFFDRMSGILTLIAGSRALRTKSVSAHAVTGSTRNAVATSYGSTGDSYAGASTGRESKRVVSSAIVGVMIAPVQALYDLITR